MNATSFGQPRAFRHTAETARKAAQANKGKTPWRRGPFLHTANAIRCSTEFQREKTGGDSPSPAGPEPVTG